MFSFTGFLTILDLSFNLFYVLSSLNKSDWLLFHHIDVYSEISSVQYCVVDGDYKENVLHFLKAEKEYLLLYPS